MDFWDDQGRGQWHLMLADILSQINGRKHATTRWRRTSPLTPKWQRLLCATSNAGPSTR